MTRPFRAVAGAIYAATALVLVALTCWCMACVGLGIPTTPPAWISAVGSATGAALLAIGMGPRCATSAQRRRVLARAGGQCERWLCTRTDDLQIDHVWPHRRGGPTRVWAMQALCADHNRGKSDHLPWWELAPLAVIPTLTLLVWWWVR